LATDLKSSQREYLNNVKKSGNNLLNIINDILDFSKMEAGKLLLDSTAFKLHDLIDETAEILSLKALEKGLEIVCVIDPILPSLFTGDAARIRQIVVNLVGNAIKFTTQGEIVLSVKEIAPVHFVDDKKYLNLAISVRDTGIGIPADKLGAIFENFTQVDASTTRKFGGTGLGLTISKGLAVLMSGSLEAESELGKGSTFTLRLSLEVANEQPIVIPLSKPVLNNVLVVDDNESNCFLMQSIFNHFDIPCKICYSGKEALALIEKAVVTGRLFDLIVADHQMPEMDGISMIKKIKAILKGNSEPFILMLSSLDRTLFQSEAENAGIDKFLTKPVKMRELSTILSKIFKPSPKHDVSEIRPAIEKMPSRGEILVVEDEPINMLLISEILKARGISVLQAFNGKQALEMLSIYEPAMIFMDVNMPEMDGIAVTRIVRKMDDRKARISIVALTADARREDRQLCLDAGMNDYISKPFRLDDIDRVLNKFFLPVSLRA
ncbi:MAG TPA: response regulator, partial [Flavitalea sp.]|nr:response regulator [Flavitalea sp.]